MRFYEHDRDGPKVTCPKCGRPMSSNLIRCAFCGERFKDTFPVACKTCGAQVAVKEAYHAGRSDVIFLYCDLDSTVLTFNWYDPEYEKIVHREPIGPNPFELTGKERKKVEDRLIGCPCGGKFLFRNPLRCPVCHGVFADPPKLSHSETVVIVDRHINGEKSSVWKG